MTPLNTPGNPRRFKLVTALIETFGFSPLLATIVAAFLLCLGGGALLWVVLSAPPRSITIASGPDGSMFERYAKSYKDELAKHGVTLNVVSSDGSGENLRRLAAPKSGVDIGFVQGGLVGENPPPGLVSLGSVAYQPLWIFTRGTERIRLLSQLAGQRIGIGAPGSGVHTLAHALLEANEIAGAPTVLDEHDSADAGKAFLDGKLDAIFLMGDSAPITMVSMLLRAPEVQVYDFTQADAYVRRFPYLHKIVMPEGAINFGHDLPPQDLAVVGPTVELVVRKGLNSAISDLLLKVARQVHGKATVLANLNEFPAPLGHELPVSSDALRFYKSGQSITYDLVESFWLANLINRLLVAIVPFFLVLIPTIRFLPVLYRWSVQIRIYRCYRPLLRLERDAVAPVNSARAEELFERLNIIERDVNALRVPASFASQFYELRNHIAFVRQRLKSTVKT